MSQEHGEAESDRARHGGRRVVKFALLTGGVALLVNEDLRGRLLDILFGAEEEFDYSTLPDPPVPSGPPEVSTEPFVRSQPSDAPAESAESSPSDEPEARAEKAEPEQPQTAEDELGEVDAGAEAPERISIAPSPAAWRAAAAAAEAEASESRLPRAEPRIADELRDPPAPPQAWWLPTKSGLDPR